MGSNVNISQVDWDTTPLIQLDSKAYETTFIWVGRKVYAHMSEKYSMYFA